MSFKISIFDGTTPVIDFIAQRSFGLAREALSVTGSKLQKQAKTDIRSFTHNWHHGTAEERPDKIKGYKSQSDYNRKVNRFIWKDRTKIKVLGTMKGHGSNTVHTKNIGDIMTFYMPKEDANHALSVTVGGAHPTFLPVAYNKGENVGHKSRIYGVSRETRAIFHKLNTGEVLPEHPYANKNKGLESNHGKFVKRPFMARAYRNARGSIMESLEKRYRQVLPQVVNNTNLKARKVV